MANTLLSCDYMLSEDGPPDCWNVLLRTFWQSGGSVPFCATGQWHGGVHMPRVGEFGGDVNGV